MEVIIKSVKSIYYRITSRSMEKNFINYAARMVT